MLPPHHRKNYLYITKKIFIACIWYITEKYTGTRYGTMHHRKNYLHITGTFFITWLWYTVHHRKIYLVVGSCQSVRYHASQKYLLRHYRIFFTTCVGTVHRYPVRYLPCITERITCTYGKNIYHVACVHRRKNIPGSRYHTYSTGTSQKNHLQITEKILITCVVCTSQIKYSRCHTRCSQE